MITWKGWKTLVGEARSDTEKEKAAMKGHVSKPEPLGTELEVHPVREL